MKNQQDEIVFSILKLFVAVSCPYNIPETPDLQGLQNGLSVEPCIIEGNRSGVLLNYTPEHSLVFPSPFNG